jgi:RNA polymerase sigma-54 factor
MAIEIKLSQKLSQSLVMTPQLQQAIKLLQLGREDYLEEIEKALLENPVLENAQEVERYVPPATPEGDKPVQREGAEAKPETDFANYFELHADSVSTTQYRGKDWDEERPSLESSLSRKQGLAEHLMWQLRTSELTSKEKEAAVFIIGNLDRNGYLSASLEELSEDSGMEPAIMERALKEIQTFDPIGVGARDLRECLLIQLDNSGMGDSLAAKIVDSALSKLETRRYEAIAKELGVAVEQVYEAIKAIQRLEPRPGRPFVDEEPIYITPDIYVRMVEGEWRVSLNEAGMPKLRVGKGYQELIEKAPAGSEKEYLQEKLKSASWLIRSIQQRQQTIYKVAESIMRFQSDFLEQGISGLKPLVLREVAEDVEMHESTVSRVTTNKYIHTPHGVFELKYFFSSGLNSADGSSVSSESVKEKIKAMIAEEKPTEPLSDQSIAEQLKREGIDIARRTVAKYREMLGIPSSSSRKKPF